MNNGVKAIAMVALLATFVAISPDSQAQQAAAAKGESYEQTMEKAQKDAVLTAKQAQSLKESEDQRKAEEAVKQKQLASAAAAERQQRAADETKRKAAEARASREEERQQTRREQERSCVIKPVMSDAEIANCKKVWR